MESSRKHLGSQHNDIVIVKPDITGGKHVWVLAIQKNTKYQTTPLFKSVPNFLFTRVSTTCTWNECKPVSNFTPLYPLFSK